MQKDSLLDRLQRLPLSLKLTGFGSFLTFVSVFLPWYADLDAFNTGDKFIGLGGPLYLLGFLIMIMAIGSLVVSGFRFFEKKLPTLPLEESHFHIFVGAMSLFLLLITNSIYFHSKFGVNITMKEMKIGMIFALFGSALVFIGGIRRNKEKGVSFDTEGKLEQLIDAGDIERSQQDIKPATEIEVKQVEEAETETVAVNIKSNNDTLL